MLNKFISENKNVKPRFLPMKKKFLLLISLLTSASLFGQTFWHRYTHVSYSYNSSVLTPDGGLMVACNAVDTNYITAQLMKLDVAGNIVWYKQLDEMPWNNHARFDHLIRTSDSCYLAIGSMYSGTTYGGLGMHKFDIDGTTKWTKIIYPSSCSGVTGSYESHCAVEAKDKGFVLSGSCGAGGAQGMFIFKTDSMGNPEWFKTFYDGGSPEWIFRNLCLDSDSGFVFFNQYTNLNKDALLIHTDKSGNLLMSATLDSTNGPSLNAIFNIDGDVYLCFNNGFVKSKLDTTPFWLSTYQFPYGGYKFKSMEKCMNSDLILSWDVLGGVFGTLRTDSNSIPRWAHANNPGKIAGEFYERTDGNLILRATQAFSQTTTNEVIVFDSTGSMDCFGGPIAVLRDSVLERFQYSPVNEIACNLAVFVPTTNWHDVGSMVDLCIGASTADGVAPHIEVFPNPTTGKIRLDGLHAPYSLEVTGIDGKQIVAMETKDQFVTLDLTGYSKGIYIVRLTNSASSIVTKIVLQ
jgi:hypothetical protein